MGRRKPRRPRQCQHHPCRRRATTLVVWHAGQVTVQCDKHATASARVAVRAGLPLVLTPLGREPLASGGPAAPGPQSAVASAAGFAARRDELLGEGAASGASRP